MGRRAPPFLASRSVRKRTTYVVARASWRFQITHARRRVAMIEQRVRQQS